MADYNCNACSELKDDAPNLVVNGLTSTECTSLRNNTGLNPSAGNNDCTDLDNMNDCLIGNMEDEIDAYEVCEWKDYMKKFVDNVWTMFKAIICAICGIWTNISNLRTAIAKLQCLVNFLFEGMSMTINEEYVEGQSFIVAGKGCSFANVATSGTSSDVSLIYVGGAMGFLSGSIMFYTSNFTDRITSWNFDDNSTQAKRSTSRRGNSIWGQTGKTANGGELVYELRIKKSQFPGFVRTYNGIGLEGAGGAFHCNVFSFVEGKYAYGQHGMCDTNTGAGVGTGSDDGHLVPAGWVYVQVRVSYIDILAGSAEGTQYSPVTLVPIRINKNGVDC